MKKIANILIYHNESEILKLLLNNIDYFKTISESIIKECRPYHNEITLKRNKVNYISYEETIKITKDFLKSIDSYYPHSLEKLIEDGTINLYDKDDEDSIKKYGDGAYYGRTKGKHNINIPMEHNIEDMYALVHEFIHYTNCLNGCSIDGFMLTEYISITFEMLLYDYLKEHNLYKEDRIAPVVLRLLSIESKSESILKTIEEYNNERNRSFNLINLKENNRKSDKDFEDLSKKIIYLIGETLAIYTYHNYKKGIVSIEEIDELNMRVNNNENLDSLNLIMKDIPNSNEIESSIKYFKDEVLESEKAITK